MSHPLTRHEALRILDLPPSADHRAVKRAYRRLAREHHPDRGGDAATFHRLQQAYERLDGDDGPVGPVVSRGRPSRPTGGAGDDEPAVDLGSVDWSASVPDGEVPLSRDRLALLLTRAHDGPVHPVSAASRAPGSRLNGLATLLASDLTSRLRVRPGDDDRGHRVVVIEIGGSNRRARRSLDRAALGPRWTRTRTSSTTVLRSTLAPGDDRRATSVRATDRVEELLHALGWPLTAWRVMHERPDD